MASNTASYDQHNAIGRNIAQNRAAQFNAQTMTINNNCGHLKRRHRELSSAASLDNSRLNKRPRPSPTQSPSASSDSDMNRRDSDEPLDANAFVRNMTDELKNSLVDKLYFEKIDERLTSLPAAQGRTCRWFLSKDEYVSWHEWQENSDRNNFLWIKGHPGTGKSTLMKFLFEHSKNTTKLKPSQITLSFFFLARGSVEEKSTTGLYRSLLHQLFEKAAESKESLEWLTPDGARGIQRNGWNEQALKRTLRDAIKKLESRSLTIFVDALDECDIKQTKDMVCFLDELCDPESDSHFQLRICFSSRHYPTIVAHRGVDITLEAEMGHTEDIKQYIRSKLMLGKSKEVESLRAEILDKSSNIFLWVVLVLDIINSEYPDKSVSIKKIRGRLREIPEGLEDLFEMILSRDEKNLEGLQLCLKWVLFATRPLQPQELYFAVQLGLDKECSGIWDQEDVDLNKMKAFVRSSSKGLAEVTRNKACEVQFIHESVRDFLTSKYEHKWSGFYGTRDFVSSCHEIMTNCCLAQLTAPIDQELILPKPLPPGAQASSLRQTIGLKFPFMEYSVSNVLLHANTVRQNEIWTVDFLARFRFENWIYLSNLFEKFNVRRYPKSVRLIYILAEKNLNNLISIHPQRESYFDVEDERYGCPILAANVNGSDTAIQTFIQSHIDSQAPSSLFNNFWKQYCHRRQKVDKISPNFTVSQRNIIGSYLAQYGDEIIIALYLEKGLDPVSRDKSGMTVLAWAAQRGFEVAVKMLIETGKVDVDSKDSTGRTPLWWAVQHGQEAIVKMLIETGKVDVDSKDSTGRTPLSWAVQHGQEAIAKMLIGTGKVDVDSKDSTGRTPLSWAIQHGQEAIVKMLIETGKVDVDSKDSTGRTPLWWAVQHGQEAIVKMLIETGKVDVDSKDSTGRTPLSWAVQHGQEAIATMLIGTGKVDVDSKDSTGRTPLSWAVQHGQEAIVKMLIETGKVDVDSKDSTGRTPLWWAVQHGQEAIVKMLIETGKVDVDSKDSTGRTPLSWAVQHGQEAIAKMLIETGKVDVDPKDSTGRTPLSWAAASWGTEETMNMLLETGKVDVDSKDSAGRTPLSWAAASWRTEKTTNMLLETGKVDVDSKDSTGRTPLSWAVQHGQEAIATMLIGTGKVDVDSKDSTGRTPLSWAVQHGQEAIVKMLIETGKVDVDSKDSTGRTPLWWAVQHGQEAIVKMLIETGKVDVDSKDSTGRTPLSWAVQHGQEAIAKMLIETGKVDVDPKDSTGRTPLSWAAASWRTEKTTNMLLETGKVDVDSKDSTGRTPLSWAVQHGQEAIATMLIETGKVDVDSKDSSGRTPLWWAVQYGQEAVMKMLIGTGKVGVDLKD